MFARIRRSMREKDQGFTLIELLVVMIIIGILAAVAIPVFLNQRKKAVDTGVKSDVTNAGKEIATYYVDGSAALQASITSGTLCISTAASCSGPIAQVKLSDANTAGGLASNAIIGYVGSGCSNAAGWYIALTNANGTGTVFKYSSSAGLGTGATAPACAS